MGFRVLSYDLYGRGFSDRPPGAQDRAFFLRQLEELLAHEGVEGSFTLLGYSMGGAIATCYAAACPDRIDRLILLAPAGATRMRGRMLNLMLRTGALGKWLMLALYPSRHRRGIAAERNGRNAVPEVNDLQEAELDWRGFVPAVLESLRGMLSEWLEPEHRSIGEEGLPVLAIWGREDSVIPLEAMHRIAEWNPESDHRIIDGVGHWLTYSHPVEIVLFIRDFLEEGN